MEREETLSNVILASPPPAVVLPSTSPPPSSSLEAEAEDGRMKSPGDAVGDTTGLRKTGWITSRGAVCFATFVILLIGLAGAVLWSLYIGNHQRLNIEVLAVICVNLGLFACSVGLSFFGICAIWKENTSLVDAYFWLFLVEWFIDLASLVALLVVIYPDQPPSDTTCVLSSLPEYCDGYLMSNNISIISLLCVYKLLGICTIYLLHFYRRDLLLQASRAEAAAAAAAAAERAQKNPLILRWLRRTSSSSFSSLFEKGSRWLSGFEIPTIKIDLASDDSSASAYSTDDSAGYRTQQFGLPPLGAGADGGAGAVSQHHQQQSASAVMPLASLPQAHLHTHGLVLPVLEYRRG